MEQFGTSVSYLCTLLSTVEHLIEVYVFIYAIHSKTMQTCRPLFMQLDQLDCNGPSIWRGYFTDTESRVNGPWDMTANYSLNHNKEIKTPYWAYLISKA